MNIHQPNEGHISQSAEEFLLLSLAPQWIHTMRATALAPSKDLSRIGPVSEHGDPIAEEHKE